MVIILDEARETTGRATWYKWDGSNAYGTVDLSGVAYLLRREGVQPQAARWYQRYLQQVRVISIMAAGVSRAWRFRIVLTCLSIKPLSGRPSVLACHEGGPHIIVHLDVRCPHRGPHRFT